MSAAAHLLRRQSSLLLHQRRKLYAQSVPSLVIHGNSRQTASVVGCRNLSATATSKPQDSTTADPSSSSGSKSLKYTAAAAAVLLLSSAAWYATRDDYPQLQHFGLPQLFHGRFQEEPVPTQIDEKAPERAWSHQTEEKVIKEGAMEDTREPISGEHDLADEDRLVHNGSADNVPAEFIESYGDQLEKNSPQQPVDPEQSPVLIEHGSGPQENVEEEEASLTKNTEDGNPLDSQETKQEKSVSSEEVEQGNQMSLETLADVVKDKVVSVKDFVFNELKDVPEDQSVGNDTKDEIRIIRENLIEKNPEMFYSSSESDEREYIPHKEDGEREEGPESVEIMESGSHEYGDAHRDRSKLSASYLVQRGHEDSVRRYSENEKELKDFLGSDQNFREEGNQREEAISAEEKSKALGVDVLVGAIHTAQQLQAEVDSRTYQEQINALQEAHKQELKDFQAKIFAYAEDTDQLEKELKKEKEGATEALKLLKQEAEEKLRSSLKLKELKKEKEGATEALKLLKQEAEEKLRSSLKLKEEEATNEKERLLLLGKAQTAAIVTREKADHLDNIHAVQLQVDALRTAFYTRSEEARVSHTAHKLAMGAFALEDAIETGEPVEKEADLLIASAGGRGVDPLVDAVVSSLPSEALTVGTTTRAQLHQKENCKLIRSIFPFGGEHCAFTSLKGTLRELALMPSGGGGVFAHLFARITANLKISEQASDNVGSEGIEVVIGKVERFLAEENLVEAAAVLETGARGTAAEGLAVEWARQARNRAIIEQGIQVLRAHVIAVTSGFS